MQQPPTTYAAAPPQSPQPQRGGTPPSSGGMMNLPVVIAIIVAVILIVGTLILGLTKSGPFAPTKSTAWTAVFLTDNEVFFGHVKDMDSDHFVLDNVYYLQKPTTSGTQTAATAASIDSLVTNQLQCPTDEINIKAVNVLYWETLQSGSYVVSRLNQLITLPQQCAQPSTTTPTPAPAATAPPATPTGRAAN